MADRVTALTATSVVGHLVAPPGIINACHLAHSVAMLMYRCIPPAPPLPPPPVKTVDNTVGQTHANHNENTLQFVGLNLGTYQHTPTYHLWGQPPTIF